jgi:hypothetical protein
MRSYGKRQPGQPNGVGLQIPASRRVAASLIKLFFPPLLESNLNVDSKGYMAPWSLFSDQRCGSVNWQRFAKVFAFAGWKAGSQFR